MQAIQTFMRLLFAPVGDGASNLDLVGRPVMIARRIDPKAVRSSRVARLGQPAGSLDQNNK